MTAQRSSVSRWSMTLSLVLANIALALVLTTSPLGAGETEPPPCGEEGGECPRMCERTGPGIPGPCKCAPNDGSADNCDVDSDCHDMSPHICT